MNVVNVLSIALFPAVVLAVVVGILGSRMPGWWRAAARVARYAAAALLVLFAIGVVVVWGSDGGATWLIAGVPAAIGVVLAAATYADRTVVLITWCAAVATLAWAILNIAGTGLYLLFPAVFLVYAAAVTTPSPRPSVAGSPSAPDAA